MKSVRFILISILLSICLSNIKACWDPSYTPGEYYVFYTYPKDNPGTYPDQDAQNVAEWQAYTSGKATLEDIHEVVYNYPVASLGTLLYQFDKKEKADSNNTFIEYLFSTRDRDALSLLFLAKKCYQARAKRWDPWWYPTKEDLEFRDVKQIFNEALAYKGKKLATRYALQAIRAGITIGEDDRCLELWNTQIKHAPHSVVKQMCESYIAGILFRSEQYDEAAVHFISSGDETSFWWCAQHLVDEDTDIERIKIMYQYAPNAPVLAVMLQQIIREAEVNINPKYFNNDTTSWYREEYYSKFVNNRKRYMELCDLSLQIAGEGRTTNPAMWQYAAAFLTMIDGKINRAKDLLQIASRMKGTPFIKDNVKILQLMVDAQLGSYDNDFEQQIFPQLKWLDNKIANHLTDEVKRMTSDELYMMKDNFSYYYYNDMMRKISLAIMAPNYLKRGNTAKAAAFAGMATERLPQLVGKRLAGYYWRNNTTLLPLAEYRKNDTVNNEEYSNELFWMLDTMKVQDVIAYKNYLFAQKKSTFDRFLTERCYASRNYLNELIGTKYIRLLQFDKAVYYLSNVDQYYEKTLNIYQSGYLNYDPFHAPWLVPDRTPTAESDQHKLHYCKKMSHLKKLINSTKNREKKAQYAYEYAVGLSQVLYANWALAAYGRGTYYNNVMENTFSSYSDIFFKETEKYLKIAESNTCDKNLQAQCTFAKAKLHWDVDYHYNNGSWDYTLGDDLKKYYDLMKSKYSTTPFYAAMASQCDMFEDYISK